MSMRGNTVLFFKGGEVQKAIHPKNLGWVLRNIRYIDSVDMHKDLYGSPVMAIHGVRGGEEFTGTFPFADHTVMQGWVTKGSRFAHASVSKMM